MNKYRAFTMYLVLVTWPMHMCTHTHRAVYLFPKSTINLGRIGLNMCVYVGSSQSCLTLCDPKDCSLPGSSVHGILQARILEWVAIPFSRGSSQPRDQTWVFRCYDHCSQILYCLSHQGSSNLEAQDI